MSSDDTICYICDMCKLEGYDLKYLQRIMTNPDHGGDEREFGYLELFIKNEVGIHMYNHITRYMRYAMLESKHQLLCVRMYFFMFLGDQESMQKIVRNQIIESKNKSMLEFFDVVFIPFVKSATSALAQQPFEHNNIAHLIEAYIAHIQITWLTQSQSLTTPQMQHDVLQQIEIDEIVKNNRANKELAANLEEKPVKVSRRKRRRLVDNLKSERNKALGLPG